MDSIRIKNLHCLADTGVIPLKDINILVGANSSGKSSFLRVFPLLKQGLNTNKRGPILWLSEDVDFGDFKTAVRKGEKSITFEFTDNNSYDDISRLRFDVVMDGTNSDFIDNIFCSYADQEISIKINSKREVEKIIINGEEFPGTDLMVVENRTGLLPTFYSKQLIDSNSSMRPHLFQPQFAEDRILQKIDDLVGKKLKLNTLISIRDHISSRFVSKSVLLNRIQMIEKPVVWHNAVKEWTENTPDFIHLNNLEVLSKAFSEIDELGTTLALSLMEVYYIGPVRATAERYYRRQNLALNVIDSRGINLPMFVNDLSDTEKKDLKDWMKEYFGFYLITDYSGGHISVSLVNERNGEKTNLADSGFGFSQIMPIVVMLWTLTSRRSSLRRRRYMFWENRISYCVIEQPELHLHPAFQAQLADMFISAVNVAKKNGIQLKLILETHSEAIINRIGRRISEKKLEFSKDNVTVALFDKQLNENGTNVTLAHFDDDGILDNWPIGFFNAD